MSATNYIRVCLPEPYIVMGLRLKPFCLGHYLLMRRFGCGYADDEARNAANVSELIKDFLLGLVICSMSYQEFLTAIETDKLPVVAKRWRWFGADVVKTVSFHEWLAQWGKEVSKAAKSKKGFEAFEKFALFRSYLNDGMEVPLFWDGDNSEGATQSEAHWSQSILLVLTGELGYSQDEALQMPLSKALADYFRYAEKNGLIRLMSDEDAAAAKAQVQAKEAA